MHYLAHSLDAFNVGLTWHPVRFQGGVGGGGVGERKAGKEGGGQRSKTFTPAAMVVSSGRLFLGKHVCFLLGAQLVLQESQPWSFA